MEPVRLELKNFTAFAEAVVDLDNLRLAALVGNNGAGKSSIIDALLWNLFGFSTKGGAREIDNVVRRGETECRVTLDFRLGDQIYRVIRHRSLGKKTMLELYRGEVLHVSTFADDEGSKDFNWLPLSAKTVTDTQTVIEQLLRMDYRTFTASSLILQGKSDSLTADMTDQERKEVLARILGLDLWDRLQEAARERARAAKIEAGVIRRQIDTSEGRASEAPGLSGQIVTLEQRLHDVSTSAQDQTSVVSGLESRLGQRPMLEQQLQGFHAQAHTIMDDKTRTVQAQSEAVSEIARLKQMTHRPEVLARDLPATEATVQGMEREATQAAADVTQAEAQVREAEAAAGQQADLDRQIAARRRDMAQVEQDGKQVRAELDRLRPVLARAEEIRGAVQRHGQCQAKLYELDTTAKAVRSLEQEIREVERSSAEWNGQCAADIARAKADIESYQRESATLGQVPCGDDLQPRCPLLQGARRSAGMLANRQVALQALEAQANPHAVTLATLQAKQQALAYDHAAHQNLREEILAVAEAAGLMPLLEQAEFGLPDLERRREELRQRYQAADQEIKDLEQRRSPLTLQDNFTVLSAALVAARTRLQHHQSQERIARDALASMKQSIEEARRQAAEAEARIPELERRRDAAAQRLIEIDRDIAGLAAQRLELECTLDELADIAQQLERVKAALEQARAEEARHREALGSLRQQLAEAEKAAAEAQQLRPELAKAERQALVFEVLDQACGKKAGVPALIVEGAVPQIETIANDVLGRMAGGRLAVRLDTQAETKSGTMSEVLRITVLDAGVEGPYQTFSGAERFMTDLALRIALTKFLSHRAGAEISLLVLDEGIGAADQVNRQAIMQALREAAEHFRKVLIVTHIAELQDALPQRVEVTRAPGGSTVKVIA